MHGSYLTLQRLTKKGEPFIFGLEQQVAFADLKRRLTQADTLGYFDCTARTKIIIDVSPVALEVVYLQEQKGENRREISYVSRSLSGIERQYSQMEKEAPEIVWACERGFMCIFMEWILHGGQTASLWILSTQLTSDVTGGSCQ